MKEGLEIFNFSTLPSYTHTYFSKGKEEGLAIKYFKSSNKVWAAYHYRDGKLDGLYAEYHDKNGLLANYTWYSKGKALAGKYQIGRAHV